MDSPRTPHGPNDGCGELLWEHMGSQPGFNEEMRQAEAELAEGRGVPFRSVGALLPLDEDFAAAMSESCAFCHGRSSTCQSDLHSTRAAHSVRSRLVAYLQSTDPSLSPDQEPRA